MFVRIGNTPRDYAWGSTTAIAHLLGRAPSGRPEAELWLGAHPGSPSAILDPARSGGRTDLAELADLDGAERPPFLLKVLAAASPLSLQAHPSPEQAKRGFEEENRRGIPLDSPDRNYRDDSSKPEMIYALSAEFDALCGFRPLADTATTVRRLASFASGEGAQALLSFHSRLVPHDDTTAPGAPAGARAREVSEDLRSAVSWLLSGADEVAALTSAVVKSARAAQAAQAAQAGQAGGARAASNESGSFARDLETVARLESAFPGDPGIVLALLLNRVTLRKGQALYLPAGNIHAYLSGLGIELMKASDNVLRGGLTSKHVDVRELVSVLRFEPLPAPILEPTQPAHGVDVFRPDVPDFALTHIELTSSSPEVSVPIPSVAIALCTEGSIELAGLSGAEQLSRGQAIYLTSDEAQLSVAGSGTLFIATTNY